MSSANFLYDHFPVQHVLAEVMQLNRKVLSSWAKFVSIGELKCADIMGFSVVMDADELVESKFAYFNPTDILEI